MSKPPEFDLLGYDAYFAGVTVCPYATGTRANASWWAGWEEAQEDDVGDGWERAGWDACDCF